MSNEVSVKIDTRQVQRLLLKLDTGTSTIGITEFMLTRVDPYMRERARQRFAREGDDVTGSWAPLAPATENWRRSYGFEPAHPINHRTGQLEEYITGEPWKVFASGHEVTLGPQTPKNPVLARKVKVAQVGVSARSGKGRPTPARPVMGFNERDLAFVLAELNFFIEGRAR